MNPAASAPALRTREARVGLALLAVLGLASLAVALGWLAQGWDQAIDDQWSGPSLAHWFGTNRLGQDVFDRALVGLLTAFSVGGIVTVGAITLGALLGGLAGWHSGSAVDEALQYLMGVIDSIPIYLLAVALAFSLGGGESAIILAMVLSFWTATARLVRAEVARLREREFILAARAIGLPAWAILGRHLLPNTVHILLVQATLTFVAAIKTEVILSFLGIGAQDGVSWGLMLAESTQDVLAGHFGNFLAASLLLFLLLLGLNLVADALQDAFDLREPAR
ncbi:MAG: ABC transporter permease [Xanthomonadales bacterium]|nr:ABC transporter permease [Xanthomonadales bacterium]